MWHKAIEFVLLTIVSVAVALTLPDHVARVAWVWALLAFFYVSAAAARKVRSHLEPWASPFEEAMRQSSAPPERPGDLQRLERTIGVGVFEPREFDVRLRPLLRGLIEHRLERNPSPLDPHLAALAGTRPADDIFEGNITVPDIASALDKIEAPR